MINDGVNDGIWINGIKVQSSQKTEFKKEETRLMSSESDNLRAEDVLAKAQGLEYFGRNDMDHGSFSRAMSIAQGFKDGRTFFIDMGDHSKYSHVLERLKSRVENGWILEIDQDGQPFIVDWTRYPFPELTATGGYYEPGYRCGERKCDYSVCGKILFDCR